LKLLFNNGDQHVGGHGAPDLRLDCVLARAQKTLDAQMLFDPLEEQFYLPATLVQRGDSQWWQSRVVGQEDQRLARFRILETDTPQMLGIILRHVKAVQRDRLIANHTCSPVGLGRVHAPGVHTAFRASHKEAACLMHFVQPGKVQIAAIHDVKGTGLDGQYIEYADIPHLAVVDMDERRNRTAQVQQRVHLHRRLCRTERRPVEQAQAKVDGGGIQRVNCGVELDGHWLFDVKLPRTQYQSHGQCVIDMPVPIVQGIRQRRAGWRTLQSHMKQLGLIGCQASLDVAQRLAPRQLREGHHPKQVGAVQSAHTRVATVTFDNASKVLPRHVFHDLRKQRLTNVHAPPPVVKT